MRLVLEKADEFKRSIDAIAVLIDEAEFVVDEKGLSLKATDPSQISLVDFHLDKKAFKEFDVKQQTKLGLDLDYLGQIMGRAKAEDMLQIELDEKENVLSLTFKGTSTRHFTIPLIDISSSDLPNPNIAFDAELEVKAALLQGALKDASLISSHVTLLTDGKKFAVRASSSKGSLNNETEKNEKELGKLDVKAVSESMFPLDYLADMVKAASSDSGITLRMKSNAPVQLSYKIGEAEINYFLAPRIESE